MKLVAEALGMNVLVNDPPREKAEGSEKFKSIEEVLIASDIISIHVPYYRSGEYKTDQLFDEKVGSCTEGEGSDHS